MRPQIADPFDRFFAQADDGPDLLQTVGAAVEAVAEVARLAALDDGPGAHALADRINAAIVRTIARGRNRDDAQRLCNVADTMSEIEYDRWYE